MAVTSEPEGSCLNLFLNCCRSHYIIIKWWMIVVAHLFVSFLSQLMHTGYIELVTRGSSIFLEQNCSILYLLGCQCHPSGRLHLKNSCVNTIMFLIGHLFLICLRLLKISLLNLAFVWSFFNFSAMFLWLASQILIAWYEGRWGYGYCPLLVCHTEDINDCPIAASCIEIFESTLITK